MTPATVQMRRVGNVAMLLVDNPPVNALSDALRADLMRALDQVEQDKEVVAGVIACEGRTFIAGADITQFGKPREILTASIAGRISRMPIPFVAALHGTALGGGFEIALGCHGRAIASQGFVGLPEVRIGLVPSGGGTQRLTKLVGPLTALELISSGRHIAAQEALSLGLIDVVAEDVRSAAVELAQQLAKSGRRPVIGDRSFDAAEVAQFRQRAQTMKKNAGKALALRRGIEAVQFALEHSLEEGIDLEQRISAEVHADTQSHAMRYLFHAERSAAKVAGLNEAPKPLQRVAVAGRGQFAQDLLTLLKDAKLEALLIAQEKVESIVGAKAGDLDLVIVVLESQAASAAIQLSSAAERVPVVTASEQMPEQGVETLLKQVPHLRFFAPLALRRLLQLETANDLPSDTRARLLAFGRKLGRATIACRGSGSIGQRIRQAGQEVFRSGAKDLQSTAGLADIAGDFGFDRPAVDRRAMENSAPDAQLEYKLRSSILSAMVNEAARVLMEGTVRSASEIDLALVHGYAYPAWRGGPMFEADRMGLRTVVSALNAAGASVAPLLIQLADEERLFRDWSGQSGHR